MLAGYEFPRSLICFMFRHNRYWTLFTARGITWHSSIE
jgi:hypothetical protein